MRGRERVCVCKWKGREREREGGGKSVDAGYRWERRVCNGYAYV